MASRKKTKTLYLNMKTHETEQIIVLRKEYGLIFGM